VRPQELGLDALEGLASLVDQSLVRQAEPGGGEARFALLETIREFGHEQLRAGGELDPVRRRHAGHFLGLAVAAEPHLTADDQIEWLDRCDWEHPNIRAALRWAVEAGEADRAQEAAGALWRFWQQRGHLAEGRGGGVAARAGRRPGPRCTSWPASSGTRRPRPEPGSPIASNPDT
jgi:predicted ATPase